MAYIVNRNDHFYVVAYDGVDPITGRERRRWHPAGRSRADAETIAASLTVRSALTAPGTSITTRDFLAEQWMPRRSALLRPTTAHRYAWMVEHYICPRIGAVPLRHPGQASQAAYRPTVRKALEGHGRGLGGA